LDGPARKEWEEIAVGLRDKHILIDGYNLELKQGTGVKTYTLALIQALARLGARVSVLWSYQKSRVPLLQEVLLRERNRAPLGRLAYTLHGCRSLLGLAAQASSHLRAGRVLLLGEDAALAEVLHRSYFLPNCYTLANHLSRSLGTTLRVRIKDQVDAWHTTYPLPLEVRGSSKVTTVHDLIPLKMPWATTDDKRFFYRTVKDALERSALVLTVSEHAKSDILDVYKVPPERVQAVHQAIPYGQVHIPPEEVARRLRLYRLRPQGYLLFVSAIQPRKNLGRLCQALAYLDCKLPLVVVGAKGWLWEEELRYARPLAAKKRIRFLNHVPHAHLHALYAGALFFAFPSLYEGFGLPPLEAMAHGCPVLTSNTSCLPEVCGDAALYVDPYDVRDLADKVTTLIGDERLRGQLRENGWKRIERYNLENYSQRLLTAYSRVLF
jgi:glycosyltransferase involved in cell wall biosynthesis